MNKKILALIVLVLVLTFTGCGRRGNVDNVQIPGWDSSELYSNKDIDAALQTAIEYFHKNFGGCTLTKLYYPGDEYYKGFGFGPWAEAYGADEAIVLLSSFEVDSSGGDGSLEPNSTYNWWQWILIRNEGGEWEHVDHGYG